MKVADLTGLRFGKLTAIHRDGTKHTYAAWRVRCDCGIEKRVSGHELRRGAVMSCGCDRVALQRAKVLRHGETKSPTWNTWLSMRQRCNKPHAADYARYGGRGILVCERWNTSYEAFVEDMGRRPDGHTLDRIDNSRGYEPGNCRWASRSEQQRNTRTNRMLTHNGETMTLVEWSLRTGLKRTAIAERIRRGWSVDEALSTAV